MTSTRTITRTASAASSSKITLLPSLPTHSQLQTWVQRPQSVAKCTIADMYGMPSLVLKDDAETVTFAGRDVFLLDNWPCRMVEIVGWVAGVDHKEAMMVITLDDGDGVHVLPVTVRLSQRKRRPDMPVPKSGQAANHASAPRKTFLTAKERKFERKAAATRAVEEAEADRAVKAAGKVYDRPDVRVGDTVKVAGRVEEWMRKKADGSVEWVRQLAVAEGSGGSIQIVDPDEQFVHAQEVHRLHHSLYSQPFEIPPVTLPPSATTSPVKADLYSDSMEPSSEIVSVVDEEPDFKLRDPSKLRSSQLTDSTFRQYLLDYLTQEATAAIKASPDLEEDLESLFPEFRDSDPVVAKGKGKAKATDVFTPTTRDNAQLGDLINGGSSGITSTIRPITLSQLLEVPHLGELARLIVETETRREERRRRKRIRDGQARPRDHEVEAERRKKGRDPNDWKLTEDEKGVKMMRMASWVIRSAAVDGVVVEVPMRCYDEENTRITRKRRKSATSGYGYLALCPDLVLPLVVRIIRIEQDKRKRTFMRKTDPRKGHGALMEDIVSELQSWGEDGKWMRIREWVVQDAIKLGLSKGALRAEGRGWWTTTDAVEGR